MNASASFIVAEKGNKNAITDAGVAALFAEAALRGALFNVQINLQSIKDEAVKKQLSVEVEWLLKGVTAKKDRVIQIVNQELS